MNPTAARAIRAHIVEEAIDKMASLFDASLETQARELIQNARRAGATQLDVEIIADERTVDEYTTEVRDDGHGIADPQILLSFGRSAWGNPVERERPAGLGMLSLARERVHIKSTHTGADGSRSAFGVELTPEHFTGASAASVNTVAPREHTGTSVRWRSSGDPLRAAGIWHGEGRHVDLEVRINGEAVERKPFLDKALRTSERAGARIGVYRESRTRDDGCWFGATLRLTLPSIDTADGTRWSARADVSGYTEGIELVLPARREGVENDALRELRAAVRVEIVEAIATIAQGEKHSSRLRHADWSSANAAGIAIAQPEPALVPYDFETAIEEDRSGGWVPGADAEPWTAVANPPDQGWIIEDWHRTGLRTGIAQMIGMRDAGYYALPPLWREACGYEGYAWYDAMPRLAGVEGFLCNDSERTAIETLYKEPTFKGGRADGEIELTMTLESGPDRTRTTHTVNVPAALPMEPATWANGADPAIAQYAKIDSVEIELLLDAAYLSYSEDTEEHGSSEAQAIAFEDLARASATRAIGGAQLALSERIERIAEREIGPLLKRGEQVSMHVEHGCAHVIGIEELASPANTPETVRETLARITNAHAMWQQQSAGEARDAIADTAGDRCTVELRAEWQPLGPWDDPHTVVLDAEHYRLRIENAGTTVLAEGTVPWGPTPEKRLAITAFDNDGHETRITIEEKTAQALRWLATRLGVD